MNFEEFKALLEAQAKAFQEYKSKQDARFAGIENHLKIANRPGQGRDDTLGGSAKEHKERFQSWARKGEGEAELLELQIKSGLSTVSDPDGGFMVPVELDRDLDKLAVDTVAMRRIAQVKIGLAGDYKRLLSTGGASGGWVGELETRSETDTPELKAFNPPWSEWYALPEVTQKMLDDAGFDVEAWLLEELLDVETSMEGEAFVSGNGVGRPKGFLSYETVANASWVWGKIGYIAGGHASLLNNADMLISLQHALKPAYRRNGVWLMNDLTFSVIRKLKDGEGNYLWRAGLADGAPDTLLGKPVEIDDNLDDIGAGEYPIAFADWRRAYLVGDHRAGRRLLRDPYTKKGWVKFYVSKRVFGGVINHQALKLLKIAES